MFSFLYFRDHVVNVHGSHIRQRIIIIRTGVVVSDVITYHEISSQAIIWNNVWNIVWNNVIVVCDGVPIDYIDMVRRKDITFSGVLLFDMFEAFSFRPSFTLTVPAKMVYALTISSKFETITFLEDGVFSVTTVWSFVCENRNYCVQLMTVLFSFSFCFLLFV